MTSDVFNMDCMEYMRTLPEKFFDLAIADPPYGLPARSTHGRGKLKTRILNADDIHRWDMAPGADFFDELFRVSRNQIIWGGNYFRLPPCRCFVCWDKKQPWENFSQCEYAWTSFDKPAKIFRFDNRRGKKIHPTQKPVDLYSWLLATFATGGVESSIRCLVQGAAGLRLIRLDLTTGDARRIRITLTGVACGSGLNLHS